MDDPFPHRRALDDRPLRWVGVSRPGIVGVALVAAVVLAAACSDTGDPPATSPPPGETTVTTSAPTTTAVETTSTTVGGTTTTTGVPPTGVRPGLDPRGLDPPFDTWTVILASLPVDEFTEEQARERLAELAPPDGGVLASDDYPSLNPGYWVVYSGVFPRQFSAQNHCAGLTLECYHRYLGPATDVAPVAANGQALLWVQTEFVLDLVAVSLDTGDVVRTIVEDRGEGEFPAQPEIAPDGASALVHIGFEDFWFSCEGVLGTTFRIDLATGAVEDFAQGLEPEFSPDGRYLAWVEAPECLEDPEEPLFFVAFHDTLVVQDLATGEERRWRTGPAVAGTDAGVVQGIGWAADSERIYLRLPDGLREMRVDMPESQALDDLVRIPLFGYAGAEFVTPLGQLQSGELVLRWGTFDGETSTVMLDLYDLAAGERTAVFESTEFVAAALDRGHTSLAWAEGTRLRSLGAEEVDVDVGMRIDGIAW